MTTERTERMEQAPTVSRQRFLRGAGALGAAGLAAASLPQLALARRTPATASGSTPIQHIIIACQENRSFDHYFGYYPNAGPFGVPPGFTQPNGSGGTVAPYHLSSGITKDISHEWPQIHSEYDNGKMDGFYTTDGQLALGYYNAKDLNFYYSLASSFALCGNFFCSLLGPTFPNRLYLFTGTSGGNTSNNIAKGSLSYPTMLDLLDQHGISWKIYNGWLAQTAGFNPAVFFSQWQNDPRANVDDDVFFTDLKNGTLPQVSFIAPNVLACEHPPASIQWGQSYIANRVNALMQSSAWSSSAFILTYDEGGGFFEHVAPPQFDAYGAGFRIPALVASPYAKRGYISPTICDHSSILKFVETVFGLPTLASINHQFDTQTPGINNAAANGQPFGPPAPPRDGRTDTGNLIDCFNFAQSADYRPYLPKVVVTDRPHPGIARQILAEDRVR